jgi:hypothetical protein
MAACAELANEVINTSDATTAFGTVFHMLNARRGGKLIFGDETLNELITNPHLLHRPMSRGVSLPNVGASNGPIFTIQWAQLATMEKIHYL